MYYTIGGEIYHHQRLGAKWGVMHGPPYPLERGEFSKPGKKLRKGNVMDYLKSRKRKKQQRKALEKARETKRQNAEKRQTEEEHAAAREKAFRSGSAEEVMKYKGEFTAAQLQEVINRLNNEQKLSEMSKKDVKTVTDKVDSIVNKLDKVKGWTEKGIGVYNTAAKIVNAFSDGDDLPIIGERSSKKIKSDKEEKDYKDKIKKLTEENNKLKNKGVSLDNDAKEIINEWMKKNGPTEIYKGSKDNESKNDQPKANEVKISFDNDIKEIVNELLRKGSSAKDSESDKPENKQETASSKSSEENEKKKKKKK